MCHCRIQRSDTVEFLSYSPHEFLMNFKILEVYVCVYVHVHTCIYCIVLYCAEFYIMLHMM